MIRSRIDWNGDQTATAVIDAGWDGLRRAMEFYLLKLKEVLNVSVRRPKKRGRGLAFVPAPKGEPPRKRTGWLQKHVQREYDKPNLKGRVGLAVGAPYGLWLELKNHPWLMVTLKKFWDQIRAQVESP